MADAPAQGMARPPVAGHRRTAIIDIGSNSVRLVVYDGPARLPSTLFNEKVMAGLGRDLGRTGRLGVEQMEQALAALARFRRLAELMAPDRLIAVATAAVRDAENGDDFIARAAALGVPVDILSGDREAEASALGVLSAIPDADGIVGDLGGGSLELVRVSGGAVGERLSLPLGVLRLGDGRGIARTLDKGLAGAAWLKRARDRPFYMVGGSWRAMAKLDMHLSGFPLPILHGYRMAPAGLPALARHVAALDRDALKHQADLSSARAATIPAAAQLTAALVDRLQPSALVVSAYGLREGLLYDQLSPAERAEDPLLVAARDEGRRRGRFAEHGDLIARWIAPLFTADAPDMSRLRHAACLLADVGWSANPDFRAELGREVALHGNWVGIDAEGRALVAQALDAAGGGSGTPHDSLFGLAAPERLARAASWGLAIRVAQRLSGGVAQPLLETALAVASGRLFLQATGVNEALYGDAVVRRLKRLASSLHLDLATRSETRELSR